MHDVALVEIPDSQSMDRLCERLKEWSGRWVGIQDWPAESLRLCGSAGVYRWFLPESQGGFGWTEADQTRGYLRLAEVDLTTTFVITQYMGAIRRIAGSRSPGSQNSVVADQWLQRLVRGDAFGTVGISHLTTSRRHLRQPALQAAVADNGFVLNGLSPWVTGAPHADIYVIGATLEDGREILAAVPATTKGISAGPGCDLVALSASCTDRVEFDNVRVEPSMLLGGPIENVMQSGSGGQTGGLQTSTLAIGLARAAANYLADEASRREDLREATSELTREIDQLEALLLRASAGDADCDAADVRGAANRLVLRTTQAAMTAAKGAGFVAGHPVGRWCREALFFLVWSCPQPVAQAHLCEMAFGVQ
jgi:alkylation response protein AidB-like acyl-CoA dehydrogenase